MNLILPAGVLAAIYFTGLKSQGERLRKCEISSFRLGKLIIGLQQSTIPVTVLVFNPNNVDVPAEYFRGVITRAGKKIADFSFDAKGQNVQLKSRQETPLTFNVRITTIGVVNNLVNIFKNLFQATPIDTLFTVDGIISIGGFDVPVKFTWDAKNNKPAGVSGIGSAGDMHIGNGNVLVTKWCTIDRLFYVYVNDKNGKEIAELGYQKNKPTTDDLRKMLNNWIAKVGKPYSKMEFNSNEEMQQYFRKPCTHRTPFSLNGN